jgi:hypothetical protein
LPASALIDNQRRNNESPSSSQVRRVDKTRLDELPGPVSEPGEVPVDVKAAGCGSAGPEGHISPALPLTLDRCL